MPVGIRVCAVALVAVACSGSSGKGGAPSAEGSSFTLFVTTELRGTIEPCGCTSDPLGDLARTAALIARARTGKQSVLYMDGGSTLYQETKIAPHLLHQEKLKADLLARALAGPMGAQAIGLGPNDLALGAAAVKLPRHAANVAAGSGVPIEPPELIEVGGVRVGVFGVVAPAAVAPLGVEASDPVAAARIAIEALRRQSAQVIVGLAHMSRKDALALARAAPGVDLMVAGMGAPEPPAVSTEPARVGGTWIVQPANRGQVVTRLDVTVRGRGPLVDAIGEARAREKIASLQAEIVELRKALAVMEADRGADPQFVATKRREIDEFEAEAKALAAQPLRVPEQGSWFVMEQVRIAKALACDTAIQAEKMAYDKTVGEANVKAAAGMPPPAPAAGQPSYVGASCGEGCHEHDADIAFWKTTRHAGAWETLEKVGKQFNFDCIGCHVTGWDQPGGSSLASYGDFVDVNCETCHGPGSAHEDAPKKVDMPTQPPRELCVRCHSPDHSDTFDYTAYLRDVTGAGHGEAFRVKLGEGPTGRVLRQAALDKAGRTLGAGCLK